jgi:hypothetical protein
MLMTQENPVATAVLVERDRLQKLWAQVRRCDGSFDDEALARFEAGLRGPEGQQA